MVNPSLSLNFAFLSRYYLSIDIIYESQSIKKSPLSKKNQLKKPGAWENLNYTNKTLCLPSELDNL